DAAFEIRTRGNRAEERLAHLLAVDPFDQHLRPILTAQSSEWRRRRTENAQTRFIRVRPQPLHEIAGVVHRACERARPNNRVDHRNERRIPHPLAELDFLLEERAVVLPARELDAVVIGIDRLDDRLARLLAPAGSSHDLREELKRAL